MMNIRNDLLFAGGDNLKQVISVRTISIKLLIGVFGYVESKSGIIFAVRSSRSQESQAEPLANIMSRSDEGILYEALMRFPDV